MLWNLILLHTNTMVWYGMDTCSGMDNNKEKSMENLHQRSIDVQS